MIKIYFGSTEHVRATYGAENTLWGGIAALLALFSARALILAAILSHAGPSVPPWHLRCWLPARWAADVDPIVAIRSE